MFLSEQKNSKSIYSIGNHTPSGPINQKPFVSLGPDTPRGWAAGGKEDANSQVNEPTSLAKPIPKTIEEPRQLEKNSTLRN